MVESGKHAPREDAEAAGLKYVTDDEPGITRRRRGDGFSYSHPNGRKVSDKATLERIRALAIPPAWKDVWIARSPKAHLQATGRDDAGRKQFLYHEDFREAREESKFRRILEFAETLPKIRKRVLADLRKPGLPKEKVLALAVRILDETGIRVGNEAYAKSHDSFGLTTLKDKHADVKSTRVTFHFNGKSGQEQEIAVRDRRLARLVKDCRDVPGQELFQYVDENGNHRRIRSQDVNAYIREAAGGVAFTAKDFRTWTATVEAAQKLDDHDVPDARGEREDVVREAVKEVANDLGNTPRITRDSYVHPEVLEAYENGEFDLPRSRRKHYADKEAETLRFLEDRTD